MYLDERQWHTAKAALRFWQAVARESRVHPMTHRSVRGMFGDGQPTPLADREIALLLDPGSGRTQYGQPLPEASRQWRDRLRAQLKRQHSKPTGFGTVRGARGFLYDPLDLETARRAILARDEEFRKKYGIPD